ncbi:hypothetical protein ABZ815_45830 [Nonomuraea sp. NPDC047529]|uniref:hypothetical protein n=1 Tax=Nonomuraea sp. NPDC047529 TaxID=3155623 RepID=UPI003410268A
MFNPSVRLLAGADGVRRTRESLSFMDPERGNVSVDVADTYDAPAQVTRGTWHLSTDSEPDFVVAPLRRLIQSTLCHGHAASTLHLRVRVIEGESRVSVRQNSS